MKKRIILILLVAICAHSFAQELEIVAFKTNQRKEAVEFPKEDFNGERCGLVILKRLPSDASFEGNVFWSEYHEEEWWVYMTRGSRWLGIKANEFLPLTLELPEPVQSNVTYVIMVTNIEADLERTAIQEVSDGQATTSDENDEMRDFEVAMKYYEDNNYPLALKWFRQAAEQGNAGAQFELGVMYNNGQGVTTDFSEALKWYRLAAEQGHALAQCNLGAMYSNGQGVAQSFSEAMEWFRLSANNGEAIACHNLGVMYQNGVGIKQDYIEAFEWYLKAAQQNSLASIHNIGTMFALGEGVSQDYVEAVKWFQRAADQGFEQSIEALKQMYYLMEE